MPTDPISTHIAHLRLRGLRPETIRQRRGALRRLGLFLDKPLLEATCDDLDRWQQSTVHLSVRYRAASVVHVGQFYRWAQEHDLIGENPAAVLIRPRTPRSIPRPIGEDDLDFALAAAPRRIRAMLALAAFAGLRACEIAALTRDHVLDQADPPVLIVDGKGGHERIVPLSSRLLMELHTHGLPSRGHVFGRGDGQPGANTPTRISNLCNGYLHDMGIPDTLHSLRHRAASQMYRRSLDIRLTQEFMGHRDPATTAGYAAYARGRASQFVEEISGDLREVVTREIPLF